MFRCGVKDKIFVVPKFLSPFFVSIVLSLVHLLGGTYFLFVFFLLKEKSE